MRPDRTTRHTRLRTLVATLLATVLLGSLSVAPVAAWANGPDGNGYGTHDWLVDQALKVVDGRADDWFDRTTALLATDDPDYLQGDIDPWYVIEHVYRESGKYGGAIHQITEHYANAVHYYEAGVAARDAGDATTATSKFKSASKQIGLLAHFWGDILQPFHSNYSGVGRDSAHSAYEHAVDDVTDTPNESSSWSSSSRTPATLTNVRTAALAAAAYSRARFDTLWAALKDNPSSLDSTVRDVTGQVLRHGANDLAAVIWSVSKGTGIPPAVGSISARMKWTGTKYGETLQRVYVKAKDVNGNAIPGLQLEISWPGGDADHPMRLFIGPKGGESSMYVPATKFAKFDKQYLTVTATTDGTTRTKKPWFQVTSRLADSTTGFRTRVSDSTVKAGQTITVASYVHDTNGRPVQGLLISWTFDYNGRTITASGYTDSNGRAATKRTIATATTRARIYVTAHTSAYSINRYSHTSFKRTD